MEEVFAGLTQACREARALGVSSALILCFLRHLPRKEFMPRYLSIISMPGFRVTALF